IGELQEEEQGLFLEGKLPAGFRQYPHGRVGIGGMPAGEGDVVIELVVGIPPQDHVAETDSTVESGKEFDLGNVFASQDAIVVENTDFDMANAALFHDAPCIVGGANLLRFQ